MKTSRIFAAIALGIALCAAPVYAQRGGGGHGGGGGSRGGGGSYSSSSSRGGGSYSSPSSSRGSSYSSPSSSRSSSYSSSSSRGGSYSSPSSSRSSSYSSPSRSSSYGSPSSSRSYTGSSSSSRGGSYSGTPTRSGSHDVHGGSRPSVRGTSTDGVRRSGTYSGTRHYGGNAPKGSGRGTGVGPTNGTVRGTGTVHSGNAASAPRTGVTGVKGGPTSGPRTAPYTSGYARAGRPGGHMPPASRPVHPAPYFHHPHHHGMIHMHPVFWDPFPPRPWYWPGFWYYCNSYWYDYHCTDVVVVREYVKDNYKVDMIDFAMSGDIMYALVNDRDGKTYMQVYSNEDKLLAEQVVNKKYCKLEIDKENGGCWIFKKNDKDPLLFIYTEGELLIYEAD